MGGTVMDGDCIFCRIVAGSAPARVVYRDDEVIAFFPRVANAKGHTLIAPVRHYADVFDMPEAVGGRIMGAVRMLGEHYGRLLGADGINLLHASGAAAQQSVFHFHMHLLPRFADDGLDTWPALPEWKGELDELLELLQLTGGQEAPHGTHRGPCSHGSSDDDGQGAHVGAP